MAAGGLVVSRRRDVHYSKKENYHPRNGYHDLDLSQGHGKSIRGENGYGSYLGSIETDNGRDGGGRSRGFVRRTRDCKLGELSGQGVSGDGISSKSGSRNNEISKLEDGELMPSEKRRKFSPIVWDRDAKEVRITSKSTLVQRVTPLCPPPPLPESFGTLVSVAADGDAAMHISPVQSPVAAESIWNSESGHLHNLPSVLSPEQCRRKDQELGQLKAENIGFRPVSASRWAYEEYSPRKICFDNTGDISLYRRVEHDADLSDTPESGEFCLEGSGSSWGNSSASDGRRILMDPASRGDYTENLVDDDIMEMDEKHDEAAGVSIADWDVEDDKESSTVQGCRSVFEYEMISKINEGTYGVVYKARDKRTGEIMALKKVKMGREREGFPLSSLREINLLLCLHHPSIVVVKEVVVDEEDGVFMVMEYMERDLKELTEVMKQPFSEREVKCLMRQLLEGVQYLHDNWVLHRDLKTSNLLLNNSGKLKICDFGLSRQFGSPLKPYTPLVVTLWYRAPELLLGTKEYSTAIDMWSVGCIMGELLAKQPLFNGNTEIEQLDKIFRVLGTPSEKIWPGFSKLPGAKVKFVKHSRNTLLEKFPRMSFKGSPVLSEQGFDLLSQLLTYDPDKRISAEAALKHSWFHVESEPDVSVQESLARRLKLTTYG